MKMPINATKAALRGSREVAIAMNGAPMATPRA
ncbi:hypothetical protein PS685_05327 [Pseudomonas fluorescens]|uniref:Uncharacterized protein n=1 Tax=Pseudomonas fluorescens TaxID=294 RepID=A0A5E7ADF2_PSEFL|nr:hypothetical protein PS685_05327 [Pseudomonas fluorescens]